VKKKWECRNCGHVCRIITDFPGFVLTLGNNADRCPFMTSLIKAKFLEVKE